MRLRRQNKNVIYVNYSPYENSGKILDFLCENYIHVFVFSLSFYYLASKKTYNNLLIYHNGIQTEKRFLFQLPHFPRLVFLLLPFRSFITLFQIIVYAWWLNRKFGHIDVFFTVNGFAAWIGWFLKKLHLVKRTIFWVWDYYPPFHKNIIIRLMRRIYRIFDYVSTATGDRVVFVNHKTRDLRRQQGVLPQNKEFPIIPLGTELLFGNVPRKPREVIYGFIGVLKESHGFGIVFDNEKDILHSFPKARYEIIGSGPDEEYFRTRANRSKIKTRFYGFMEGATFTPVLQNCTIGIATYIQDPSNVSYYGDPGKIKLYLSLGIPVIATDVIEFAHEIRHAKAGEIIHSSKQFTAATAKIMKDYDRYVAGAKLLAKKYYYKKIYSELFTF